MILFDPLIKTISMVRLAALQWRNAVLLLLISFIFCSFKILSYTFW